MSAYTVTPVKKGARRPVKPAPTVETAKGGPATAHVVERPVKGDDTAVRWFGYAGGKSHGFIVPPGPLEATAQNGKIAAVCGSWLEVSRLAGDDQRCKKCVRILADDTRKPGKGLSERNVDVVDTGSYQGDARDAEKRRAEEIAEISGDAPQHNVKIVTELRQGTRTAAIIAARVLDARGPAAPVPVAENAPEGREERQNRTASSPGPALVRGRAMAPVQPQKGWAAKAGTMSGPTGRERFDPEASTVPMHGGAFGYLTEAQYSELSRSQQRKYWARVKRARDAAEATRAAARGKGDSVERELERLRGLGVQ